MKQSTKGSLNLTEVQPQRDHIQGPHNAPIQMLEYGDYECPYCGAAHGIVKALQQELGNRLCFAFRNFPLANVHPHAQQAAEAAEAAGALALFDHDVPGDHRERLARRRPLLELRVRELREEIDGAEVRGVHAARYS